jgi:hypothetical protein
MKWLKGLWDLIQSEPVAFQGVVQTGVAMACGFGLQWDGKQIALVMVFTQALLSFLTRKAVTPNATVQAQVQKALYTPVPQP